MYLTEESSEHHKIIEEASVLFMHDNALNPSVFPSLRRMENEVVAMCLGLLHGPEGSQGCLTTGGTESVLMAVKTWRDFAQAARPNMVACQTVHPAFEKAAHYFGVEIRHAPPAADLACDVQAMAALVDSQTILLVGSAPQYPHGIVDRIEELAEFALRRGIPLHVDACAGGLMLPFVERLGYPVPGWDFRVRGVSSISADIHKYGFAPKGASVVLFREAAVRKLMFFQYSQWPGGLFVSPSMTGSRGGAPIAAAWASLVSLGEEGFLRLLGQAMEAKEYIRKRVEAIADLEIVGRPQGTILAIRAKDPAKLNILAVGDVLESDNGWKIDRQQNPASIHLTCMPAHHKIKEAFSDDLAKAVVKVLADPAAFEKEGSAAMYVFLFCLFLFFVLVFGW